MQYLRTVTAFLAMTAVGLASMLTLGAGSATACSCVGVDAIDVIATVDAVFVGTPLENVGTDAVPVWRFAVDGVIKGDVASEETILGDGPAGCAPDFGRFVGAEAIVVYAYETEDGRRARACTPTLTVTEFADLVAAIEPATGTGRPAAIMAGVYQTTNLAVIDDQGRTITRTAIDGGAGAVAHCPGTTTAAIVSWSPESVVTLVDLESMTVIEKRPDSGGFMHQGDGTVTCLDGGATVITLSNYGPNNRAVELASNTRTADGAGAQVRAMYGDVSRAVIGLEGTVILLPSTAGGPLRLLATPGLQLIGDARAQLPDGVALLDGDLSPDGTRLALLARVDGIDLEWDTGATHILVLEIDDGVPAGGPASVVELVDPGLTSSSAQGAAKWIRWFDDSTWIVESETESGKRVRVVSDDGHQAFGGVDVSWGWGLVPIPRGMLRSSNGGIEVITVGGTIYPGDPTPLSDDGFVDRNLWLAPLIDAPDFAPAFVEMPRLEIRPVGAVAVSESPPVATSPADAADQKRVWLMPIVLVGGVALIVGGVRAAQRPKAAPPEV